MLTCYLIAGALWIQPPEGNAMFKPTWFDKEVNSEYIFYGEPGGRNYRTSVQQHEVRMTTAEWVSDCVSGAEWLGMDYYEDHPEYLTEYDEFDPEQDIDVNERTGIDD